MHIIKYKANPSKYSKLTELKIDNVAKKTRIRKRKYFYHHKILPLVLCPSVIQKIIPPFKSCLGWDPRTGNLRCIGTKLLSPAYVTNLCLHILYFQYTQTHGTHIVAQMKYVNSISIYIMSYCHIPSLCSSVSNLQTINLDWFCVMLGRSFSCPFSIASTF